MLTFCFVKQYEAFLSVLCKGFPFKQNDDIVQFS